MQRTRRGVLQAGAVLSIGTLTGCLGNSNSTGEETLDPPTLGQEDAPVLVESFEDFTCKYCRQFSLQILPQIISEYVQAGTVRYQRRDFPFLDEEWSWKTANAARAVQEEAGEETFYEYVDLLYQNFDAYSLDTFGSLAESVGADPGSVRTAATDGQYQSTLQAEKSVGEERNVSRTPTVFVNGSRAESPRYEHVATAIESELTGD